MPALPLEQLLNEALHLQYAGKLPEARSIFRKVLKKLPAHAETLHFIGVNYMQSREPEKGLVSLRHAIAIKPDYVDAHYSLGVALNEVQHFEEAVVAFSRAISLDPLLWKAHLQLGNALHMLQRHEQALGHYRQALALAPQCVDAYVGLGAACDAMGNQEESISAYRQAIVLNPGHADAHNNLGFALGAVQRFEEAAVAFEKAITLNPAYIDAHVGLARAKVELGLPDAAIAVYQKAYAIRQDAQCAYEMGETLAGLKRLEEALAWYRRATENKPDFMAAWGGMGIVLSHLRRFEDAADCFRHLLRLDPNNCDALNNLGNVLKELGEPGQASLCYRNAISVSPDFVEAHNGLGNALTDLNRFGDALACFEQALTIRPDYDRAAWNCGLLFLKQGYLEQGWQHYEKRHQLEDFPPVPSTPYPRWLGEEDIFGKSLFIQVEQGHGDAIQMMRYVELLRQRGAECWIQCPESLGKLFGRSFPFAGIITTHAYPEPCDYHVPLMSLPLACKTFSEADIPANVPYLEADPARIDYWKQELASWSVATVGLVWRGNPTHDNDHNRSAKLAAYLPLIAKHPEIRFVTLQKDLTDEERSLLEGFANVRMLDAELTDFDESAAVMRNLDLMISIDSAPAHLAGALAVPTWILLPFNGEWRWLMERDDTPWYPTARLFRQPGRGDWDSLIEQIHTELGKLGETTHA